MAKEEPLMAAIVLAGHSPQEEDPLADYSLGRPKGLIAIAGRPMIAYVVEALTGSRYVGPIVVVGLPPEGRSTLPVAVEYVSNQGDILANAEAGVRHARAQLPHAVGILVTSADVPLLTPQMVDDFADRCLETSHDLYYSIVERSVMESRFPTSRRTYVRLMEGEFAGGDLILAGARVLTAEHELWRRLASARKNPLRQAGMIGIWPLIKLLARRMSLAEAEQRASRALGVRGRAVVCSFAEVAMDVDKPFQLEIVRAELEARLGGSGAS